MTTYTVQAYKNWSSWYQVGRFQALNAQDAIKQAQAKFKMQMGTIRGYKFEAEED